MALLAVLTIMVAVLLVVSCWSVVGASATDDAGPVTDSGQPREEAKPETLEGVLVRQLIDKKISGSQYCHAM